MLEALLDRVVQIEFYDHVSGSGTISLFTCRVWGKLVSVSETAVVVQTWQTLDDSNDDNNEYVVLIRRAIISITPLSVVEKTHVL